MTNLRLTGLLVILQFALLCIGGIGTILWPLSERLPKQDYRMSNRTLLCFSLHYGGNRTILWPRSKTPPTSSWQTVLLARKSNRTRLTGSQYDQLASSWQTGLLARKSNRMLQFALFQSALGYCNRTLAACREAAVPD
jgi:hypothetical protein